MSKVIRINERTEKTLNEIMKMLNEKNKGLPVKASEALVIEAALYNHKKLLWETYQIDNVIKKE